MKASARNQFTGIVTRVNEGTINAEVEVELDGGQTIVAMITLTSLRRLQVQSGQPITALIKASSVVLVTEGQDMEFSARNTLPGAVEQVRSGAVNSEVLINLEGGGFVTAIITNESVHTLSLKTGTPVLAIFKASSVILGVSR